MHIYTLQVFNGSAHVSYLSLHSWTRLPSVTTLLNNMKIEPELPWFCVSSYQIWRLLAWLCYISTMSSAYYSVAMLHTGKLCWQSVGEDFNGTAWECADLNEQMPKESSGQNGYESHTCWIFIYHALEISEYEHQALWYEVHTAVFAVQIMIWGVHVFAELRKRTKEI